MPLEIKHEHISITLFILHDYGSCFARRIFPPVCFSFSSVYSLILRLTSHDIQDNSAMIESVVSGKEEYGKWQVYIQPPLL